MEDSERRKAIELLKEMRSENKDDKSGGQEARLNWMYKGPSDLVDREEYLLGKAIDKSFEVLNSGGNGDLVGRTGEQSNVPKKLLEKTGSIEQVDIAKKILEDPLYAIKQKEMEARKKLLNNPVKLKQIKQMLMERNKQNKVHKQKKKKSKKKTEQELNVLILKKLKKFTDKEKMRALNKIMKTGTESSSTDESSSSEGRENKKHKRKRKKSESSSEESDSDSSSSSDSGESEERHRRKTSRKRKREGGSSSNKKKEKKKESSSNSESSSSDSEREKKAKSRKSKSRKSKKSSSSSTTASDSSSDSEKGGKTRERSKNAKTKRESKRKRSGSGGERGEERRKASKRDDSSDEDRKSKKSYGLTVPEGSRHEGRRKTEPPPKYERKTETKAKYVPAPKAKPLSEKEREEKLREMMEDAKVRKQDREKNLANHRKKQAEEEAAKDYDDDFMRRQMSHLTSRGTMAERIKSNINNIQRSKSSMDNSFVRK